MDRSDRSDSGEQVLVGLESRPEKRLIRRHGSTRHVDFRITVGQRVQHPTTPADRQALNLALVIDRSGSMTGEPLQTAKRAALAVLDRLEERDNVAIVVFDDRIDLVQPLAPVTSPLKSRLRGALAEVEARGMTALHEGWLTGCQAIAGEASDRSRGRVSRCFLLTDGLANVGTTDPEMIASEAAGIWENAQISTSTFGIGSSYDEFLLGPLAVAGGGQFHHLRSATEIATTFVGELGDLLSVAVSGVRLELEVPLGVEVDVVSHYWATRRQNGLDHWSITIGDLIAGEERHVVVGFRLPSSHGEPGHSIRARLVWSVGANSYRGDWTALDFTYADNPACDAEPRDPAVMRWISRHQADQGLREATTVSRQGDQATAQAILQRVRQKIQPYADQDADLSAMVGEVEALSREVAAAPLASMASKEVVARAQRRSRGQRDYRY